MASSRSRRTLRAVAPLGGLLLAGLLVWQGSNAAFTGSTSSGTNNWTAGVVGLTNNSGPSGTYVVNGAARFNAVDVRPGQQRQRCITVRSDGGIAGDLKFYVANLAGTGLQDRLRIRVQRAALPTGTGPGTTVPVGCGGFPGGSATTIHNAFMPNLPASWSAAPSSVTLAPGVTSNTAYRIRWRFVSTGSNATDNLLQGTSASADFVWELQ